MMERKMTLLLCPNCHPLKSSPFRHDVPSNSIVPTFLLPCRPTPALANVEAPRVGTSSTEQKEAKPSMPPSPRAPGAMVPAHVAVHPPTAQLLATSQSPFLTFDLCHRGVALRRVL